MASIVVILPNVGPEIHRHLHLFSTETRADQKVRLLLLHVPFPTDHLYMLVLIILALLVLSLRVESQCRRHGVDHLVVNVLLVWYVRLMLVFERLHRLLLIRHNLRLRRVRCDLPLILRALNTLPRKFLSVLTVIRLTLRLIRLTPVIPINTRALHFLNTVNQFCPCKQ